MDNLIANTTQPRTADTTNKSMKGLSIDIPVAWEYEPVFVKSMYGDSKIDLRNYMENKMVDHGLEFNDKLSKEFVDEALDDEFFD